MFGSVKRPQLQTTKSLSWPKTTLQNCYPHSTHKKKTKKQMNKRIMVVNNFLLSNNNSIHIVWNNVGSDDSCVLSLFVCVYYFMWNRIDWKHLLAVTSEKVIMIIELIQKKHTDFWHWHVIHIFCHITHRIKKSIEFFVSLCSKFLSHTLYGPIQIYIVWNELSLKCFKLKFSIFGTPECGEKYNVSLSCECD